MWAARRRAADVHWLGWQKPSAICRLLLLNRSRLGIRIEKFVTMLIEGKTIYPPKSRKRAYSGGPNPVRPAPARTPGGRKIPGFPCHFRPLGLERRHVRR